MSEPWRDKVRKALRDPRVVQGIAVVASAWMKDHIDENKGRGPGGGDEPHKPLKRVVGTAWLPKVPKGMTAVASETRTVTVNGKKRQRTFYKVETVGYRSGGQPLRDTGKLQRSLTATGTAQGNNIRLAMRGLAYGRYQDRGFSTKGPNYIPLTMKGKRQHGTGNNPNSEGLTRGRDFTMAWKGVTVPARPFILPTREDLRSFGRSVFLGLKAVLRGR